MIKKIVGTLAGLALLFAYTNATAASKGSLFLVGKVKAVMEIYVDPVIGDADVLDITGGETDRKVADVQEVTNHRAGYRIMAGSENAANLQHSNGTDQVAYTIKYDGSAATPPGTIAAPAEVKNTGALAASADVTSEVLVSFTAQPSAPSGTYTDTLVFSIVAL